MNQSIIATPLGPVAITTSNSAVHRITLFCKAAETGPQDALATIAAKQITSYFTDSRCQFDLPIVLDVSPFMKKILTHLQSIPRGQTQTYGDIAKRYHTSARAVGQACRHNPLPIIIPCHRVIAANSLGGFSGQRLGKKTESKRWLLQHELDSC